MKFSEIVKQATVLLQESRRVSYRALKREFELDDATLQDLSEELIDIQEVAVDKDGKMLVWRGAGPSTGEEPHTSAGPPPPSPPADPRSPEAELRHLTVMFCDIVDSTVLSEQLDPEELREIVRAYQQTSAEVIERFDGHIAQYLGDGLLVYFGYPRAHEDDAERAVRAGLGVVEALQNLNARSAHPIEIRVGVHTGRVVIGEMGGGGRHEQLALGDTPNIAARIQGLAPANAVVMSEATQQLVEGLFASKALGARSVKGIADALSLYQIVGEGEAHSRFEAAVKIGLTPMVGREEEVGLLQRHWEQVKEGNGQVVLLSGEPGIGKSRLVQVLKEHVLSDRTTRIEFRCSPYYQNTALYPIIGHLERVLKSVPHEAAAVRYERLERLLTGYDFPRPDTLPLMAQLLSLPLPDGCPALDLSPERQKQRTLETLVAWILEDAERHPVYCAFEDLHWTDASTMEILQLLLEHVSTARLLVVLTFRPDFRPPWELRSHFSHITLGRLGRAQVEQLILKLTDGKALPADVAQQIVAKTDGVPLFVEELTKMVLGSGLLRLSGGHYELNAPLAPLAIPSTLQDSLMARLDRLASARELAQLGATLGREFSSDLIRAVSSLDEAALQTGLAQLVEAELIYRKGLPPHTSYLFKHALIQDTAYQSLLKSRRQQFHQRIAQVLEEKFREVVTTQPELLAHHYTEAGLAEQAIVYWQQAGQRAVQRSANAEAVGHFTTALDVLQTLPVSPERDQQELTLQLALGVPVVATKGYASTEAGQAYSRAHELCEEMGNAPQFFPALYGLFGFYLVRADYKAAHAATTQLLSMAKGAGDSSLLVEVHPATGLTYFWLGEFASAREHCEAGDSVYDPIKHRANVSLYMQDPGVGCLSAGAWALWCLGYPDQAQARIHQAIALATDPPHPFSLGFAMTFDVQLHQFRRERQETQERAQEIIALSTEQGFAFWLMWATFFRGWALAMKGDAEEGAALIRHGLDVARTGGAVMGSSMVLGLLAEAHSHSGRAQEAQAAVAEALVFVEQTGERYCEAELYRLQGDLTLGLPARSQNSAVEAETCYQKAIEIAKHQQAKSWELRAATSLARLWQGQGKPEAASEVLAPVSAWFTEGFDTRDLQDAKALLQELS